MEKECLLSDSPASSKRIVLFTWAIENFSLCLQRPEDSLSSSLFRAKNGTHWKMSVQRKELSESIECSLIRDCAMGPENVRVGFQFLLLTDTHTAIPIHEPQSKIFGRTSEFSCSLSINDDPSFPLKDVYLSKGTLMLQCKIWRESTRTPLGNGCTDTFQFYKQKCTFVISIPCAKSRKHDDERESESSHSRSSSKSSAGRVAFKYRVSDEHEFIHFSVVNNTSTATTIHLRLRLLDTEGTPHLNECSETFFLYENDKWEFPDFVKRSQLYEKQSQFVTDDERIRIYQDWVCGYGTIIKTVEELRYLVQSHAVRRSLRLDLKNFFDKERKSCDMWLQGLDGEPLGAHRALVCSRSLVFAAMMERDMAEKKTRTVHIPDMTAENLAHFLSFLYSETLDDAMDCDSLARLYVAGDRYGVLSLKNRCSSILRRKVTRENVWDVLEFADLHQDVKMRDPAIDILCHRTDEILLSDEWEELKKRKRELSDEIIQHLRTKRLKQII